MLYSKRGGFQSHIASDRSATPCALPTSWESLQKFAAPQLSLLLLWAVPHCHSHLYFASSRLQTPTTHSLGGGEISKSAEATC